MSNPFMLNGRTAPEYEQVTVFEGMTAGEWTVEAITDAGDVENQNFHRPERRSAGARICARPLSGAQGHSWKMAPGQSPLSGDRQLHGMMMFQLEKMQGRQ